MFEGSDDKESACNAGKESEVAQSFLDSATLWTVTYQALLSMGFSRQEYWSGLPCPSPENLPNPGIKPGSPTLWADTLPSEPPAMQETEVQFLGQEDTLEEDMATHSSILAWRIPSTEKHGGFQSMGWKRVGHD